MIETPADAMFTVAEIESEGDRLGVLNANAIGMPAGIPKAVLITQTAFDTTGADGVTRLDPSKAAPLIAAGWKCLVEAYPGETADPPAMEAMAKALGWPKVQSVFGLHQRPLSYFAPWMKGGWGVYLGEYLLV